MRSTAAIAAICATLGVAVGFGLANLGGARPAPEPVASHAATGSGVLPVPPTESALFPLTLPTDGGGNASVAPIQGSSEPESGAGPRRTVIEVPRQVVQDLVADPDAFADFGRAIPHRDGTGRIDGYRISGIRRGSIGEQLGLRNGDVVHQLNEHPLASVSEAMEAYPHVAGAGNIVLQITRRGERELLEYKVK